MQKFDYDENVHEIVREIQANFRTFGGGKTSAWSNPIAEALKEQAPQFAAGVDIEEVVRFVMRRIMLP